MALPRDDALACLAAQIPIAPPNGDCTLVAIDGRDGAGKTTFADELAAKCRQVKSRNVIRISIDDFHNPRDIRYRRGPKSPEGFWLDSYDYERFRTDVLHPLGPGGSRRYQDRSHDLASDEIIPFEPRLDAPPSSVVIIDGIFLHREELAGAWAMSIFLDVSAEICAQRMAVRDGGAPALVPEDRYFGGQKMYLESSTPHSKATFVVDNSRLDELTIMGGH